MRLWPGLPQLWPGLPQLVLVLVLLPAVLGQRWVLLGGDLVLGGLFPVHEEGRDIPCSARLDGRGLQLLEAMLFAVDQVNRDQHLLPNTALGVHILDTCSSRTHALNQSLTFVRHPLSEDSRAFMCMDGSVPLPKYNLKLVSGVIEASGSEVSINVAHLFRLFRMPQISPASTAETLSNKAWFELFARTVPSDAFQAKALVDMVQKFNWTYVSTVVSGGSYGVIELDAFQRQAAARNICIATTERVPASASADTFERVIVSLTRRPMARGVILFVRPEDAR